MVTIPRGVDLDRFDPASSSRPDRGPARAWGVPDDGRTRILLAGRLTRIKGHLTIVEAARRLARRAGATS
jgi:glycosyltransferase involved in cell wall biosynthesis